MRVGRALAILVGCAGDPPPAPAPVREPPHAPRPADAAVPDVPVVDSVAVVDSNADPLAELRARDAGALAAEIERRVAQSGPKMKLTVEQGRAAAAATLAVLDRGGVRELARVMPRSTVELARAVAERGVSLDELDRITAYLVRVVAALDFARLATFDDNHSHVTGREWHEIDYSGEAMTWQGQRAAWLPKGVESFKRAAFIHAYFVGAERLPHWSRVYRPRGRMSRVVAP